MKERYVHTVWCDDLRQELGNKASFMGVYAGVMQVSQLPLVLPRLGVFTWICSPIERRFNTFVMRIVRDDGFVLAEVTPKSDEFGKEFGPAPDDATMQVASIGASFGPVEIPDGCRHFKVVAEVDGELLEGPKLRIGVDKDAVARAYGVTPASSGSAA